MASVKDLVEDEALGLAVLHLPHPDADVRWVAVSELTDPTPFLEGGEILLTTALEMADWEEEWDDYIRRLVAARVCALGLGIDLTLPAAPSALLKAAERWQLNLIEIPRRTTFVALSRAVADLVRVQESRAAQRSLELHQALTRAAARSDEPDEILKTLADALTGMACMVDVEGAVQVGPVGPKASMFAGTLVAEEVARIQPRGVRAASSVPGSGGTLMLQPIGVHGRPTRYLVVGFEGSGTSVHRAAIAAAVVLLNLAEEHRHGRLETRRKLAGRAIEVLLHGDLRGAELLLGASANAEVRLPATCVALRAAGAEDDINELLDRLGQTALPAGLLVHAMVGEELVALGGGAAIRELAEVAARRLRVGVGRSAPIEEVGVAYRTAGLALEGAQLGHPGIWRERLADGVAALLEPSRAQAFADGILLRFHPQEDADLLATLGSFLRHHGSHVRVARELGIHRNTVAQRVRAIEARLGRSLDDPQTRVDVWTALQIAKTET